MYHMLIGERERCSLTFAQKWLADSVKIVKEIKMKWRRAVVIKREKKEEGMEGFCASLNLTGGPPI